MLSRAFLFFLILPSLSWSMVDMKNFNYVETFVDFHMTGAGFDLEIKRTYNSRSLYNGRMGFGWCSNFETSLQINPEGNIKIAECGSGKETIYSARETSKEDVDKTVKSIIAKYKQENKSASAESIQQLAANLAESEFERSKYAKKYNITAKATMGTVYKANGVETETVTIEKNYYLRTFTDGSYQRFDFQGQLVASFDRFGNFLKYEYDQNGIKEMSDSQGRRITFKVAGGKIQTATLPNGGKIEYSYENVDDLFRVKTPAGEHRYEYDEFHNLKKATDPKGQSVVIQYDNTNDWVTGFTDKEGCNEAYSVELDPQSKKLHYWTSLKKTCKGAEIVSNRYEFLFKLKKSGEAYMAFMSAKEGSNVTEYKNDEILEKPIFIRKNEHIADFTYEKDGRLKTKTIDGKGKFTYTYYPSGQVKEVQYTEKRNKALLRVTSSFTYENGNLTFAQNSEGQKISMKYDKRGRVFEIQDHTKKVVKIEYDARFTSLPAKLTRPGLGSVVIPYLPNGEMGRAESPEGPSVANQIVMVFNNYLDLVTLAQPEASL